MTLYEMLDKTKYYQEVWIFENNAYDQNMLLFEGTVVGARSDDVVWDWLMCEVETYDCTTGLLDIRVRDGRYEERLETHYNIVEGTRPWLYSAEIDKRRMKRSMEK